VRERLLPIAGAGTFGDLAVMTPDGEYVYATFDYNTMSSTTPGGVAVVHVPTRTVVSTCLPGHRAAARCVVFQQEGGLLIGWSDGAARGVLLPRSGLQVLVQVSFRTAPAS
jgi:hypothetical protein